jgi:HEAT repeats
MGMVFRVFIVWGMWDGGDVNRGRRVVISLVACGVVAMVLTLVWPREREPVYKGRRLSEWLVSDGVVPDKWKRHEMSLEAAEAVRESGTNALPFLMTWLWYETPEWRRRLGDSAGRIDHRLGGWCAGIRSCWRTMGALEAFTVLGPLAKPVIPELAAALRSTNAGVVMMAACALDNIGLEAVPTLLDGITNKSKRGPWAKHLSVAMRRLGTNGSLVVPTVVRLLGDEDEMTAAMAAAWLGNMRATAGVSVPALAASLGSRLVRVRREAARALGRFGEEARPEVGALVRSLRDSDRIVRIAATNALENLAPEMLRGDGTGRQER